jgi:SPP1 gp7 family putative phage head morphogenesis protein
MPDVKYGNLPFAEAIKYFQDKGLALNRHAWWFFDQQSHAKAFTVANVTAGDVLEDIHEAVDDAVSSGMSLGEFKKGLREQLTKKGWFAPKDENAWIQGPDGAYRKRLNGWRLDTIYNANLQSAYSAGRYIQQMGSAFRPYWQYKAIMDSRTRPPHAAMHNKIWHRDNPIWDTWYPPNGFNCRCYIKTLSARQVEGRDLDIETVPVGEMPDDGWANNPGKEYGGAINQGASA